MASFVAFRLMFRVANRAAFERCLARVLPLLGPACEPGEGQPYWKIPELWECCVTVPAQGESVAEQVLAGLITAKRLASGWYIFGSLSTESADGFHGVFAVNEGSGSSHVVGLEWASFQFA